MLPFPRAHPVRDDCMEDVNGKQFISEKGLVRKSIQDETLLVIYVISLLRFIHNRDSYELPNIFNVSILRSLLCIT